MRNIKKLFLIIITLFISLTTFGCKEEELDTSITTLTIYTINDFHGALFEEGNSKGIFKIGDFLIKEKENNPDSTLIISAGDMFQGTAVSSMTRGRSVVDAMNIIGFDAMTIGNHEFDWGIEEILKYQDGRKENGEAEFPFLVSNVLDKNTNKLASWAKPYTVIEKGSIRIGIIGVIGRDQTNDILASYVENYEFTREIDAIKKYAKILRNDENCDIVIVSAHCDTSDFNIRLSSLAGDEKIDALINGHTHKEYYGDLMYGDRYVSLPYVQSGSYGQYIGKITLKIYNRTKDVFDAESINLRVTHTEESEEIKEAINKYQNEIEASLEYLGKSGEYIGKDKGGKWASNVICQVGNATVGIVNGGGIRSNGFPIKENDDVTYGDIFEMMPFENEIRTVEIKGSELRKLYSYDSLYISDTMRLVNGVLSINNEPLDDSKYYKVATIDFLYEKSNYPFKYGKNGHDTNILFRDALVEAVKTSSKENGLFMPSSYNK